MKPKANHCKAELVLYIFYVSHIFFSFDPHKCLFWAPLDISNMLKESHQVGGAGVENVVGHSVACSKMVIF